MSGRGAYDVLSRGWDSSRPGKVHFIGIAGSGMRSLARVFLDRGWTITGSDTGQCVEQARLLVSHGLLASRHAAANVEEDCSLIVHSDAISVTNPEMERAAELKIPVLSYFDVLGRLMWEREGIAIAGTHGKSTTTAMLAHILIGAGLDPTVVFGAAPAGETVGGRAGQGPIVVVEACEYNANFLKLFPKQAVLLNIEPDHFDCYDHIEALEHAFALFACSVSRGGRLLVAHACPLARKVTAGARATVETYGLDPAADWAALEVMQSSGYHEFAVFRRRRTLGRVRLKVPGLHNVYNALAAAAVAWNNGVSWETIQQKLEAFRGIQRRIQLRCAERGVSVVDDYAHHPTAMRATLRTVRQMFPRQRLWCVFEPHQASRLRRLLHEMADALCLADRVLVTEIFRARESSDHLVDLSTTELIRAIRDRGGWAQEAAGYWGVLNCLARETQSGDVVVMMGAGNIQKVTDGFVQRLRSDRAAV